MSINQNKEAVRRIPEELFNQGNLAAADEVFATDFKGHRQGPPDWPTGVAFVQRYVTELRRAFPDFHFTIDDLLAEGDRVAARLTASGTQTGAFLGIPATGKTAVWSEIHMCHMRDGQVVEHWVQSDRMGMLQQLGVVPQ